MPRIARRRPIRRRVTRKRANTVSKATKKYVKRMMPKVEMKQIWTHQNEIKLSTLAQGTIQSGPNLDQGTTAITRVGNEIRAAGLHIKGTLYNDSGAETFIRCVIVGHNSYVNPVQNFFRTADIGTQGTTTSMNGADTMYFPVNKADLHVYHDKLYKLGGSAAGTAASNTRMFSKFIKFNGRKVTFEGPNWGSNFQNWQYSIIWFAADANDDTSTGTTVELSQLTRFYYKDP